MFTDNVVVSDEITVTENGQWVMELKKGFEGWTEACCNWFSDFRKMCNSFTACIWNVQNFNLCHLCVMSNKITLSHWWAIFSFDILHYANDVCNTCSIYCRLGHFVIIWDRLGNDAKNKVRLRLSFLCFQTHTNNERLMMSLVHL